MKSYEYAVMHSMFPDEPHRGPCSQEEAEKWVKEAEANGYPEGAFYVGKREVGPWEKADN